MVSGVDGYGVEVEERDASRRPTFKHIFPMKTKKLNTPTNIEIPESVNREADRIEEDTEAMLRLIDYLFFLKDSEGPPS